MSGLSKFATVLAVGLAVAPGLFAQEGKGGADSDTRAQARKLFERGVASYDKGEYEKALDSFQEAYRLMPNPVVRVNIANCYDKMDRPIEAIFHFERFLSDGEGNAAQKREVESAIKRLRKKIGELTLQIVPDGSTVQIDGAERRQSPVMEPIKLTAGKHLIEVNHPDYQTESREIEVLGGKPMEVSIVLRRPQTPPPVVAPVVAPPAPQAAAEPPVEEKPVESVVEKAPKPEPEVESVKEPRRTEVVATSVVTPEPADKQSLGSGTAALIVGALTVGLGISAAVVGVLALGANSDYKYLVEDAKNTDLSEQDRAQAREDAKNTANRAKGLALATDILLGGTALGAVITLVLILTRPSHEESAEATAVVPVLNARGAGAMVTGRF